MDEITHTNEDDPTTSDMMYGLMLTQPGRKWTDEVFAAELSVSVEEVRAAGLELVVEGLISIL